MDNLILSLLQDAERILDRARLRTREAGFSSLESAIHATAEVQRIITGSLAKLQIAEKFLVQTAMNRTRQP